MKAAPANAGAGQGRHTWPATEVADQSAADDGAGGSGGTPWTGCERHRRGRILLADSLLRPVADPVREDRVQARHLAGAERDAGIVGGIDRLQLALHDVLGQRAAGDLAR
jgi:hypothetical protein